MASKNAESDPNALFQQALALHRSGRLSEAASLYAKLLALFPANAQLLASLGIIALQQGRPDESERLLGQSLMIAPDEPVALSNRGIALQQLNRPGEALASYERAILLNPDSAELHNNRGLVLAALGRPEEALAACDRALALMPGHPEAHNNRGSILQSLARFDEALASHDRAIAARPNSPSAFNNRGKALRDLGRLDEAAASYAHAIALRPDYAEAHYNLAVVLEESGGFADALASYDRAIALKPDYASAQWNKSLLKLLTGDYEEGWPLYEWRWKRSGGERRRSFDQPLWLGEPLAPGTTVLIHAEQGLGDTLQLCRYAPLVEALGARVVLELPSAVATVIATLPGHCTIVARGAPLPAFDRQCPIMSLPLACRTTVASIPAAVPYLFADAAKREAWRRRLGQRTRPRIGVAGSAAHGNDRNRSIPPRMLEPLLRLPLDFHVLQKDLRPGDADSLGRFESVHWHSQNLGDFSDTAALIQEMDLVISVDTSVAHLAGALGRPVWILLPFKPDWRWMLGRSDSPWYPTAVLHRQSAVGDWSDVISEVAERLRRRFGAGPAAQ